MAGMQANGYWRRWSWFYILICRNQEVKYDTYYNLSVGDIQAHPHSDTIYFNKATPPNMDTPFDLMGSNYI